VSTAAFWSANDLIGIDEFMNPPGERPAGFCCVKSADRFPEAGGDCVPHLPVKLSLPIRQ
jgi:hypothetical protein